MTMVLQLEESSSEHMDDGTEVNLALLLQNLKENLHLAFIAQGVEEKAIKDEKSRSAGILQSLLVLQ